MIGMIALAGIVVRNAHHPDRLHPQRVARAARRCEEAILESGAVRFRPIFLTAGAAMLGAWPITLDPIFSGPGLVAHLRAVRVHHVHFAGHPDGV